MSRILLIHGWLATARTMEHAASALRARHDVTVLELPRKSESLDALGAWLRDYLLHVSEPFDIIAAHSMGCAALLRAMIGMETAPAPKILLCCPAYGAIPHLQFLANRKRFCETVIKLLPIDVDAPTAARQAYELAHNDWRITAELPKCEISVISGNADFIIGRRNVDKLCADLKVTAEVLPNAGHNWIYLNSKLFSQYIEKLIDKEETHACETNNSVPGRTRGARRKGREFSESARRRRPGRTGEVLQRSRRG